MLLNGPVCTNRPIRQDYLDQFVWNEIIRLLDDPELIQTEIDRRREAARSADPLRKREEELRREQARVEKSSERLVTAYQEGLLTLAQLRQRVPALQKQTQTVESELQSLKMAAVDEAKYLQLAESLAGFRSKLRVRAEASDIAVRQQILRLLVKEVLVGVDTITLRHSNPIPQPEPGPSGSQVPPSGVTGSRPNPGYLLRSRSHDSALRRALLTRDQLAVLLLHWRFQPALYVEDHPLFLGVFLYRPYQQILRDVVEEALDVQIQNPVIAPASLPCLHHCIQRRLPRSIPVGIRMEQRVHRRLQFRLHYHLRDPIRYCRYAQLPLPTIGFRYLHRSHRRWKVTARRHPIPDLVQVPFRVPFEIRNRLLVDPWECIIGPNPTESKTACLTRAEGPSQQTTIDGLFDWLSHWPVPFCEH
jgi:hypothetical protein